MQREGSKQQIVEYSDALENSRVASRKVEHADYISLFDISDYTSPERKQCSCFFQYTSLHL